MIIERRSVRSAWGDSMTDHLIRALSRQPATRLVRPLVAFVLSVALAFGGGAWLAAIHLSAGGAESAQTSFVWTWLRDATLALPLVMAAVWFGLIATRRLLERSGSEASPALAVASLAVCVGGLTALTTSLFGPLHQVLFATGHTGHELPFALHMLRDALAAFPVDLLVAGSMQRQALDQLEQASGDAESCRVWRRHVETMRRVASVYGRCLSGAERSERLAQVQGSEREFSGLIKTRCKGL